MVDGEQGYIMDHKKMIQLLTREDTRLLDSYSLYMYRGWNPLKRLRLVQQALQDLSSYLQWQNPRLIRELIMEASGKSSKEGTSKQEETPVFYLTFTGLFTEEMEGWPTLLALTVSQAEILSPIMAGAIKVSCNLVDQLGHPVVEGIYMTRTRKEGTQLTLSDSQILEDSGPAGEETL